MTIQDWMWPLIKQWGFDGIFMSTTESEVGWYMYHYVPILGHSHQSMCPRCFHFHHIYMGWMTIHHVLCFDPSTHGQVWSNYIIILHLATQWARSPPHRDMQEILCICWQTACLKTRPVITCEKSSWKQLRMFLFNRQVLLNKFPELTHICIDHIPRKSNPKIYHQNITPDAGILHSGVLPASGEVDFR